MGNGTLDRVVQFVLETLFKLCVITSISMHSLTLPMKVVSGVNT